MAQYFVAERPHLFGSVMTLESGSSQNDSRGSTGTDAARADKHNERAEPAASTPSPVARIGCNQQYVCRKGPRNKGLTAHDTFLPSSFHQLDTDPHDLPRHRPSRVPVAVRSITVLCLGLIPSDRTRLTTALLHATGRSHRNTNVGRRG